MIPLPRRGKDLSGRRFGRILALSPAFRRGANQTVYWQCLCDCGAVKQVRVSHLTSGRIVSCGCRKIKHGLAKTREHKIWCGMRRRCFEEHNSSYRDYGGRGITVCDRWLDFDNFIADMGPAPDGYSIERKDVNGNYEPANCTWISMKRQSANRRSHKEVVLARLTIAELRAELDRRLGVFG